MAAKLIKHYWKFLLRLFIPVIFLPLFAFGTSAEVRCGYVIIIMAFYWMTESIPLAVTALIPVFAFPLLGVLSTGDVCIVYMKETNMMFIGGLIVATAVEHCNLHNRIALFVMLHVGQSPPKLLAGFMLTSMFLSMWISNTASTAMMVPIVNAIMNEINKTPATPTNTMHSTKRKSFTDSRLELVVAGESEVAISSQDLSSESPSKQDGDNSDGKQQEALRTMAFLGIAYSSNIGGTGTLTGTSPNLILKATLDSSFGETPLNFASWMAFNVPGMILCVVLAWIWLQILFMGCTNRIHKTNKDNEKSVKKILQVKYEKLGPITFHEISVFIAFTVLVFSWLFRSPGFVPGWAKWLQDAYGTELKIGDATPAIFIVFILFLLPKSFDFWCSRNEARESCPSNSEACLTWSVIHEKIPWGVVLLIGGGLAMAEAAGKSGLSSWLGGQLTAFEVLSKEVILLVITILTATITEVASNTAAASILLPVLRDLSVAIHVNPLYLMLPTAVACSYAFMLPVATPPNAIVHNASNMQVLHMMRAGAILNVVCVLVINLMINTLGVGMFDLDEFPDWANTTLSSVQ